MTTLLEAPAETIVEESYQFTMNDRCCATRGTVVGNARGVAVAEQGYYRATKSDMELFFCVHHYNQHEDALLLDGWKIESDEFAIEAMGTRHKVYSEVDGE